MDFVSVRDLKIKTGDVWKKLDQEKELVITSNGKPIALMSGITGQTLESTLMAVRRARGEGAIRALRQRSQATGLARMEAQEIETEIKKTRQHSRKSSPK